MKGINKISHSAPRVICGVGFVILGREQSKDEYISSCFRNNRITIITEQQEVIKNCFVNREVWQHIIFPEELNDRGSLVVWINVPYNNKVIVIGIINKKEELNNILDEFIFKQERNKNGNRVSITGDGKSGSLTLLADGKDSDNGEIYIKALNGQQLAILDIYVQGNMSCIVENEAEFKIKNKIGINIKDEKNTSKEANISYILGEGFEINDEFGNNVKMINGEIRIVSNNIKLYDKNGNLEPSLLGDKTGNLFDELYTLLNNMVTVLEAASSSQYVVGPPVMTATKVWKNNLILIQRKMKLIKSKIVKIS